MPFSFKVLSGTKFCLSNPEDYQSVDALIRKADLLKPGYKYKFMRITVVGTGYVGLVSGTCLAETGVTVTCVDVDASKIALLNEGGIPIYEPGLRELVIKNRADERLFFTTSLEEAIVDADAVFIALGTPPDEDGRADLSYVLEVAREVGQILDHYAVVVTKSPGPWGTNEQVKEALAV